MLDKVLLLNNPLRNNGSPRIEKTQRGTKDQINELDITLQDHYFRSKTLRRIIKQHSSFLPGLANSTGEHHDSSQQMLKGFVNVAVKLEEFQCEILDLRRMLEVKKAEICTRGVGGGHQVTDDI
ncbi:MAG: hypothetical protein Q9180_004228 [Flavoplaca navasiana]